MQRVQTLIQKISELASRPNPDLIEVDLMMDYTRVLYADLAEWRNRLVFTNQVPQPETTPPANVPQVQEEVPEKVTQENITEPVVQQQPETTLPQQQEVVVIKEDAPHDTHVSEPRHEALAQSTVGSETAYATRIPAESIQSMIGINDKYQFISELFGNNKDDYDAVIEELETFENYPQALSWLNTYTGNRYNWDYEHETVQSFLSIIERYYYSR
ncbi:MAG TPA: hypothetical protein VGD89_09170 [Flavipsychrobacter sp.]